MPQDLSLNFDSSDLLTRDIKIGFASVFQVVSEGFSKYTLKKKRKK